jgi:peptidoglycan/xylan/chitin deacetylase (PgdA/CDA1 family)
VLPLATAVRNLSDGTLPAAALAITFDDGYAENLTIAAPVLRKHGLPATVFVATGYLDGGSMFNDLVIEAFRSTERPALDLASLGLGRHPLLSVDDRCAAIDRVLVSIKYLPAERRDLLAREILRIAGVDAPTGLMLTRDAVALLPESGLDVGAHTVTHPILAKASEADAWREIEQSKHDLEALLGRTVSLFAYPNGQPGRDYRDEHVRMVRDAGFSAAVSTACGAAHHRSDVFQLPRFTPWSRQPVRFDLQMLRNLWQRPATGTA